MNNRTDEIILETIFKVETKTSDAKRFDLSVPYSEKDEAKELGAKWDASVKKWYTLSSNPNYRELLNRWEWKVATTLK
jgi:hypothetical protein